MGLLDKAKDSQNTDYSGLDSLLNTLDSFNAGVDFSSLLFRHLADFLKIEKAALFLISDKSGSFECLLTKGYDKTTSNRLRLDDSSLESYEFQYFQTEKKPFHTKEIPLFLKSFMSTREFGLLEEIYWLPFFVDDHIVALIMISQWSGIIPDSWEQIFQKISIRYSLTIFNSRKSLIKPSASITGRSNKQDLINFIDKFRGKNILIIIIDLNPLILLFSRTDGLSHVNIKREILSVIKTMAGSQQEIFELHNNHLILILDNDRTPDKDLFIHQISASLPLLFQDLEKAPPIQYQFYTNPVDEISRDALISEII